MTIWLVSFIIFLLIFMSALLSASETALTGSARPRIHRLAKKGNKKASLVERLQAAMEEVIGAILLGNTLANTVSSILMTGVLVQIFGEIGMVYASIGMTFFILLFAEVMPKLYAVRFAEKSALFLSPLINQLIKVLKPFTRFFYALSRKLWRVFGVNLNAPKDPDEQEEELRGAIDMHRGAEPETDEERHMLNSILDLDRYTVEEVMIHRKDIVSLDIALPPEKLIEKILATSHTRYPVWEKEPENIIGILHTRNLLRAINAYEGKIQNINLKSLTSKPWFIPKSTTQFDQLQAFRKEHAHMGIVIDEYGALQGIVTLEDILEEIVGEIGDEHDPSFQIAQPNGDGSYTVKGHTPIRDLNRHFDWGLSDEEATTLAGLILYKSRRIPKVGQEIILDNLHVKVLQRQRNQLTLLRVFPKKNHVA